MYYSIVLTKFSVNLWGVQTKSDHKLFFLLLLSTHESKPISPKVHNLLWKKWIFHSALLNQIIIQPNLIVYAFLAYLNNDYSPSHKLSKVKSNLLAKNVLVEWLYPVLDKKPRIVILQLKKFISTEKLHSYEICPHSHKGL